MGYKGWVEVMREAGSCEGTEKSEDGDELGPPYILSSSSDHMTIYLYLFGSLHFLIHPFLV